MKKILIISNLITFVSGLIGYFILKYALPQFFFSSYPIIIVYYMAIITAFCIIIFSSKNRKGTVSTSLYFILKGILLVLSIIFFWIMMKYYVDRSAVKSLAIVFVSMYLVIIFLEAWVLLETGKK